MDQYQPLDVVGTGSFGVVRKVMRKCDGMILAQKELDYSKMGDREKKQIVAEVNILRELRHPNIIRYYERHVDRDNCRIYVITEFCEQGDLASLIKKCKAAGKMITEEAIWSFLAQLVFALHACHTGEIVPTPPIQPPTTGKSRAIILHRDVKPDNVFLDSMSNVKLGDFGLARVIEDPSTQFASTYVGTPFYMSPELVNETAYTTASDIWALGCLVYELAALEPPFRAQSATSLAAKIKKGEIAPLSGYSRELNQVVRAMLQIKHEKRPTTSMLMELDKIKAIRYQAENSMLREYLNDATAKENLLIQKESLLVAREQSLSQRESVLAELELQLKNDTADMESKKGTLIAKETSLVSKETELRQLEQTLLQRETDLRRRSIDLQKRESEFTQKQSTLSEQQQRLSQPSQPSASPSSYSENKLENPFLATSNGTENTSSKMLSAYPRIKAPSPLSSESSESSYDETTVEPMSLFTSPVVARTDKKRDITPGRLGDETMLCALTEQMSLKTPKATTSDGVKNKILQSPLLNSPLSRHGVAEMSIDFGSPLMRRAKLGHGARENVRVTETRKISPILSQPSRSLLNHFETSATRTQTTNSTFASKPPSVLNTRRAIALREPTKSGISTSKFTTTFDKTSLTTHRPLGNTATRNPIINRAPDYRTQQKDLSQQKPTQVDQSKKPILLLNNTKSLAASKIDRLPNRTTKLASHTDSPTTKDLSTAIKTQESKPGRLSKSNSATTLVNSPSNGSLSSYDDESSENNNAKEIFAKPYPVKNQQFIQKTPNRRETFAYGGQYSSRQRNPLGSPMELGTPWKEV